jgi:aspartate/methionine/tyrosine aminotransferase
MGRFTESVIRRMTRVANACGAINLSQGFPDFDPPPELQAALERVSRQGPHHMMQCLRLLIQGIPLFQLFPNHRTKCLWSLLPS